MIGRMMAAAALLALAACASSEPLPAAAPAPPPPDLSAQAAPVEPAPASGVAAPGVAAPPAPRPAAPRGDIVVPGQVERTLPPQGDPRSSSQRADDIRAWDQCVSRVQDSFDGDPMSASLDSPEDACRQQLGMTGRTAIPDFRRRAP